MIKGKQKHPSRICFECTHYEACQAWNVGTLVETDATHCVNYRASVGKTNADRIRAMSDEELADKFEEIQLKTIRSYGNDDLLLKGELKGYWLDWLKKEVSE